VISYFPLIESGNFGLACQSERSSDEAGQEACPTFFVRACKKSRQPVSNRFDAMNYAERERMFEDLKTMQADRP
jgi:hypothetical protein